MRKTHALAGLAAGIALTACSVAVVGRVKTDQVAPASSVATDFVMPGPEVSPARETTLFVTSEGTNTVGVLHGDPSPSLIASVPTATDPHNLGISPDGRWIATGDRMANSVSIIDTATLTEVRRVPVGRQPHDIQWHPSGSLLFVSQEREHFITRIEAGTWKPLAPLQVGAPQHDLAIWPGRPDELWFTVTNSTQPKALRVYHLDTNVIDQIDVSDVHDVFFTPDGSEVWTTSSGFPTKPSDRIVTYDPVSKKVTSEFRLGATHYPFHSLKRGRDSIYFPERTDVLYLSDRLRKAILVIEVRSRQILREVPVGSEPFHMTWSPARRLYVSNSGDSTVTVIDTDADVVVATLSVLKRPHGLAVLYR